MTYKKSSPKIVAQAQHLHATGLSIRKIAATLGTSKNIVEAALKKPASSPIVPTVQVPRLELYRRVREPGPAPDDLSPEIRAVYDELRAEDLVGALDCLVIALDLPVPRCRIGLNVLDADDVLCRLKAAKITFDVDLAIQRLTDAFATQDEERRQIRERVSAESV